MTMLKDSSALLLKQLDEASIGQYYFLNPQDEIYYLGERTTNRNYKHGSWNDFISNYQKGLAKRGTKEWPHRENAIKNGAILVRNAILQTKGIKDG